MSAAEERTRITRDVTPDWLRDAGLGWVVAKMVVHLLSWQGKDAAEKRDATARNMDELKAELAKESPEILASTLLAAIIEDVDRRFEELGAFASRHSTTNS